MSYWVLQLAIWATGEWGHNYFSSYDTFPCVPCIHKAQVTRTHWYSRIITYHEVSSLIEWWMNCHISDTTVYLSDSVVQKHSYSIAALIATEWGGGESGAHSITCVHTCDICLYRYRPVTSSVCGGVHDWVCGCVSNTPISGSNWEWRKQTKRVCVVVLF